MRYNNLYTDIFNQVETDIEKGLYEQALQCLNNIDKNIFLTKDQKTFSNILRSDIHSHLGLFREALALQKKFLTPPPSCPHLKAIAFQSHAFTLGYTGTHSKSEIYFKRSKYLANNIKNLPLYYSSDLGMIDTEFHDYAYDRFCPDQNTQLLKNIIDVIKLVKKDKFLDEKERELFVAQLNFRKAILLWLNQDYAKAITAFNSTWKHSRTFFKVWALFGLIYCSNKLNDKAREKSWRVELKTVLKIKAWRKNAMKYWPVALLLGRTWDLMGDTEKAQNLYRDILLNVRNGYTKHGIASIHYSIFITRYIYPVYREAVKHYLEINRNYRIALNRAEMFRARFLSEDYRMHFGERKTGGVLTPNIRIDEIGEKLSKRFKNDISILYCFDFRDKGTLLLSRNLASKYSQIQVSEKDYRLLKTFACKPSITLKEIIDLSGVFQKLTHEIKTGHLLVIPHGIFNHIPFHSLLKGSDPLIKDTLVNYWPSLQMAALGEQESHMSNPKPMFIGTMNDPASQKEIECLTSTFKSSKSIYDPTDQLLINVLNKNSEIVHIVTHGCKTRNKNITTIRLNNEDVELSTIAKEIKKLPRVVLLNVCYGGYIDHTDTDSIHGLPVTFFQKGTESAIVSRRKLTQEISRKFSQRFYQYFLNNDTLGEAYRKAILDEQDQDKMLINAPYLMGNSSLMVTT